MTERQRPRFPVFNNFYGPPERPSEAWALRSLGYDGRPSPARHVAAMVDEVASGVATLGASPEFHHVAAGWRAAHKGLAVAVPSDLLRPRDVLVAAAHALSMGIELLFNIFPPGPPAPAPPDGATVSWLRWQFTLRADRGFAGLRPLLDSFDLFPLRFVSASYVEQGRARPFEPATLDAAVKAPAGRNTALTLSPGEDWSAGDHLLLALVDSRVDPYWVVAATVTDAVPAEGLVERLDVSAARLLDLDAYGGFLHPLEDLVWANVTAVETWNAAGRDPSPYLGPAAATGVRRVDVERFPSHEHFLDGVSLLPACLMWMGRGVLRHVVEARAAAFQECDENRARGPGRRRITLGDPRRGVTPELALRQSAMRRAMNLEPRTSAAAAAAPSAEELRLRLQAEQRARAAIAPHPSVAPTSAAAVRRGLSVRSAKTPADAALELRFAVKECAFDGEGLNARAQDGSERRVAWAGVGAIVARQMPPDPPYERVPFLDIVPASGPPLRILSATRVNYAELPGGAAPIVLENLRRLGRLALERAPAASVDAETRAFLQGRPPQAFAGLNQFTAYDSRY